MSGQSELPPEVYTQDDIDDPTLRGLSAYLVVAAFALGAGLAFSTQWFAYLVDFTSRLVVDPSQVTTSTGETARIYRYLAPTIAALGAAGLPLGYWYSQQPKTIRFRPIFAFSVLLMGGSALLYVYSFERTYPFWQYGVWIYHYHDVSALTTPLYRAGGYGLGVATVLFIGFYAAMTGQVYEISGSYGSAHWGDGEWLAEGQPQTATGKLLSQAEEKGVPIGWRGDRMLYDRSGLHAYVQAPTGSGKTVGFVMPTLLLHPGSVFAIDIKRELYYVSARRRSEINDEIYRLDPFAEDIQTARYNPLDLIDTSVQEGKGNSTAIDDARSIANSLVVQKEGGTQNPFFIDSARQLLYGLILYVCVKEDRESGNRHLGEVRRLLMQSNQSLRDTLEVMGDLDRTPDDADTPICAEAPARVVREQGNQFAQMSGKEFSSVASTARAQTGFLSSTHIQDCLSETTFRFREMQTRPDGASVYLCLPAERLSDYFRWLRLMIISAQTELVRLDASERQMDHPSLFMLEEAPRLGKMEAIDEGLSLHRGYNIQYMVVAQSFNQLKDAYGEEIANNILANCKLKLMWGAATKDEADMISEMCGQRTVAFETTNVSKSRSAGEGGNQKTVSDQIQEQSRALVSPDEVSRISEDWTFVFMRGEAPLLVQRPNYVTDRGVFDGLDDPHPEHSTDEEFEKARQRRIDLGIEVPLDDDTEPGPLGDGAPPSGSAPDAPDRTVTTLPDVDDDRSILSGQPVATSAGGDGSPSGGSPDRDRSPSRSEGSEEDSDVGFATWENPDVQQVQEDLRNQDSPDRSA
jgi:type IV secretion system protein VirD4